MEIKVGFIGLGDMGSAMAQKMIEDGFETMLWARRQASIEPFLGFDVEIADTPRLLGAACDFVGVCVFADEDVKQVVLGNSDGVMYGMKPGGVIAIHSTVSMETCLELDSIGKKLDIRLLDAPVSGARARQSALDGELVVMVGGEPDAFEFAKPVLQSFGGLVRLVGSIGSGQKAKILNNTLSGCNLYMGHLVLQTAAKLGLNQEAFAEIACNGSARSAMLELLVKRMIPDPEFTRLCASIAKKDGSLFQKMCREAGIPRSRLNDVSEEHHVVFDDLI